MFYAKTYSPRPQYRYLFLLIGGLGFSALSAFLSFRLSFPSFNFLPDFVSLYVLFFVFYGNPRSGYLPSMLIGATRDLLSVSPFGSYIILYGLAHKFLAAQRQKIFRDRVSTNLSLSFFSVFAINLGYHGLLLISGSGIGWKNASLYALEIGLLSAPCFPILVFGMKYFLKRLNVEQLPGGYYNV